MRSCATRPRHRPTTGTTASPSRRTRPTPSWATSGASAGTWVRRSPDGCVSSAGRSTTRSWPRRLPGASWPRAITTRSCRLPRARDRRTEIRWAIRDVELRTGSRPTGLWLPEAAVDWLTLRIAAEEGIRWTILAPWQADGDVDTRVAHRVELGDDLRLVVGFYDAGLSATVSFDAASTADADGFAAGPVAASAGGRRHGPHLHRWRAVRTPSAVPGPVPAATADRWRGRPGHRGHHARVVAGLARRAASCPWRASRNAPAGPVITVSRAGRPSAAVPPMAAGRHPCDRRSTGSRGPSIRSPTSRLAGVGLDAWAARDRYVDVASGYRAATDWVADELARAGRPGDDAAGGLLLALMQAQASRLAMFASLRLVLGGSAPTGDRPGAAVRGARRPTGRRGMRHQPGADAHGRARRRCASRRGASGLDLYALALDAIGQLRFGDRTAGQARPAGSRPAGT